MTLEYLNGHLYLLTEYYAAADRLKHMRAVILGAVQYDGMPHGAGISDKTAALAIALSNQEEDVRHMKAAVEESGKRVAVFVNAIRDNRCRLIFSLRYQTGLTWDEVAHIIGGGNTGDTVRMAAYRYLATPEASAF